MEKYRELLTVEELALVEMHRTCIRVGVEAPMDIFMKECFERIMRCNNGDRVALTGLLPIHGMPAINMGVIKQWKLHNMGKTSCCPYMWAFDNAPSEETIRGWGYEILPNGFSHPEILDVVDVESDAPCTVNAISSAYKPVTAAAYKERCGQSCSTEKVMLGL